MTEEELYREVDPEVEAVASRSEKGVQRQGSCWSAAGLCLEVGCTWEGCWWKAEEWTAEGGELKLEMGADERGPLTDDGGSCGAKCRRAWRDGCRWDSEELGRMYFG